MGRASEASSLSVRSPGCASPPRSPSGSLLPSVNKGIGSPQLVWVVAAGAAPCLCLVMQRSVFPLVEPFKELSGLEAGEGREL